LLRNETHPRTPVNLFAATRDCEHTGLISVELFLRLDVFSLDWLKERGNAMLSTILIIVLILLLIGALPTWPYSSGWGYYPGGGLGLILIIVIILAVAGRL
jgi:hypothetical protein